MAYVASLHIPSGDGALGSPDLVSQAPGAGVIRLQLNTAFALTEGPEVEQGWPHHHTVGAAASMVGS